MSAWSMFRYLHLLFLFLSLLPLNVKMEVSKQKKRKLKKQVRRLQQWEQLNTLARGMCVLLADFNSK